MSIKKPHAFTWGLRCQMSGLDSRGWIGVSLTCEVKDGLSITPSYTPCTTPFHLFIRSEGFGVEACESENTGAGLTLPLYPVNAVARHWPDITKFDTEIRSRHRN